MRAVPTETIIDLSGLADQSWTAHVIAKGETLSSISKGHFGTSVRWKEIAKANPGIDPAKLKIGRRIELPPQKTFVAKDGKRRELTAWRIYWWAPVGLATSKPILLRANGVHDRPRYGAFLIAIPHERKKEFDVLAKKRQLVAWSMLPGFAKSKRISTRGFVKIADLSATVRSTIKISSISEGVITTKVIEERLNAKGKLLTWRESSRAPLLAFSGLGIMLFVGVYFRRRDRIESDQQRPR